MYIQNRLVNTHAPLVFLHTTVVCVCALFFYAVRVYVCVYHVLNRVYFCCTMLYATGNDAL